MTADRERRVTELEKRAADDADTDTPVVPEDPTDLPHSAAEYYMRAIEHTSHPPYRDLSAKGMGGDDAETDPDPDPDEGPYPHAAERFLALAAAEGDLSAETDRDVPEHVRDDPQFEVGTEDGE